MVDFPKKKALAIEIKLILDTLDMIFSLITKKLASCIIFSRGFFKVVK